MYLGDGSNIAQEVTLTGDVTIDNVGVSTIGASKVTTGMIADGTILVADLATDAVETAKIKDANVTNAKLDKTNIPLSGFGAAAADVALGTNKLTGVADPTLAQDAATKNYADTAIETVQTELDATQTGAGLNTDGTYTANASTNYISEATALNAADDKLDAQAKVNATDIANNASALGLKAPLASPIFTGTVSGITKAMVGLGRVDNTSDATKNAETATLTNKTLTSPIISTISNTGTLTLPTATGTIALTSDITDVDVSKANLKTRLAGGFAGNAVSIGDSDDTVTILGDLTVTGTTTTNNVETVSTSNGVVFEGYVADNKEVTLLAGKLSDDRTITLPNATGTVALTSQIKIWTQVVSNIFSDTSKEILLYSDSVIVIWLSNINTKLSYAIHSDQKYAINKSASYRQLVYNEVIVFNITPEGDDITCKTQAPNPASNSLCENTEYYFSADTTTDSPYSEGTPTRIVKYGLILETANKKKSYSIEIFKFSETITCSVTVCNFTDKV